MRELQTAGHGVGLIADIPAPWQGHLWHGTGSPTLCLTNSMLLARRTCRPLPSQELLAAWPALEAPSVRALNLFALVRLVAILHADPVFVSSSRGALQDLLVVVSEWSRRHDAILHVGPPKTVAMSICPAERRPQQTSAPPLVEPSQERPSGYVNLCYVVSHRWLGVIWPVDLHFKACLEAVR